MKGTLMPFKLFIESRPARCMPHALTSPMFSLQVVTWEQKDEQEKGFGLELYNPSLNNDIGGNSKQEQINEKV